MTAARLPRTAAVLGGGAVGQVLLPALRTIGVRVVAAWTRSPKTPQWRGGPLPRAMREAELVLLSVDDAAIAPLCAQLAEEKLIGAGQLVAHLAGALDLAPLAPAKKAGARIGSLHPLRAVPPGSRADAFAGAAAGIAASDEDARALLTGLAQALGMTPLAAEGSRALYHAAAVLAGGAQVSLFSEAVRAFQAATGAAEPDARAALLPLSRGALEALASREPEQALTGPIPRGDAGTLAAHLAALARHDAKAASLYRELSRIALTLSRKAARAPDEQLAAVDTLLAPAAAGAAKPEQRAAPAKQPAPAKRAAPTKQAAPAKRPASPQRSGSASSKRPAKKSPRR